MWPETRRGQLEGRRRAGPSASSGRARARVDAAGSCLAARQRVADGRLTVGLSAASRPMAPNDAHGRHESRAS